MGEDPELDKTVKALRARAGFTFKLYENPLEDPDLVAKYPDIKGPNKNLIREIRRERRVELFAEGYRWDDVCRWNVGEIVFNRVRRGAKMDPVSYTHLEFKEYTVKGTVIDATGQPLPGVNITVQGTTQGATTDLSGSFTLQIKDSKRVLLVASYIGFSTKKVWVSGETHSLKIMLEAVSYTHLDVYKRQPREWWFEQIR